MQQRQQGAGEHGRTPGTRRPFRFILPNICLALDFTTRKADNDPKRIQLLVFDQDEKNSSPHSLLVLR